MTRRRAPAFWSAEAEWSVAAALLGPVGGAYGRIVSRRASRPGHDAGVPVLCCGNAVVGGAGKTTLAIDLAERLAGRGWRPHVLTRGHGGDVGRRVHRVDPARDAASLVGDEALLLAAVAPVHVSADRAAAARAAVAAGADILLMDDGLQHPGLRRTASFLVVDGGAGFGNGRVMPAGPLRESPWRAASRCRAVVLIGEDRFDATAGLRLHRPILRADLVQGPEVASLRGRDVIAFAGIGRPAKFFDGLAGAGARLIGTRAFPDHHPYRAGTIATLVADARRAGAILATTPKDAMRIPAALRRELTVVGVSLRWADDRIDRVLDAILDGDDDGPPGRGNGDWNGDRDRDRDRDGAS